MTSFVAINWFFCIITCSLLVIVIWRQRFLLVKPSMIVVIFFHLRIQWAATIDSPYIELYLPDPWIFALLAQGFPLIGLLVSYFVGRRSAWIIWQRILHPEAISSKMRRRAILFLGGIIGCFTVLYLHYVPFSSTGIYAIFMDPSLAVMAREESLKLLESGFIKYGYSFTAYCFAPLLSVLLMWQLEKYFKGKQRVALIATLAVICAMLFAVSITGARGFAGSIILVMIFALFLRRGFPLNLAYIAVGALLVLAIPTLLTILREEKIPDVVLFWHYLSSGILDRVFHAPMQTGLYYTHYAQTAGFIGVSGIPKLSTFFGIPPTNAANYLGLLYTGASIQSVNMNTSYVFAYYCYFGIISFAASLIGLWLLDLSLIVYRKLSSSILIACVASISMVSISFTSGEYTTTLLTNGFGTVLLTSVFIDRLGRLNILK